MRTLQLIGCDVIDRVELYSLTVRETTMCDANKLTIITRKHSDYVAVVLIIKIRNTMTQFMYQRRLYKYSLKELRDVCHLHPRALLYLSPDGSLSGSIIAEVHFTKKGVDELQRFFNDEFGCLH